jgi:hypothetical protein
LTILFPRDVWFLVALVKTVFLGFSEISLGFCLRARSIFSRSPQG